MQPLPVCLPERLLSSNSDEKLWGGGVILFPPGKLGGLWVPWRGRTLGYGWAKPGLLWSESRLDTFSNRFLYHIMGTIVRQTIHRMASIGPVNCTMQDHQIKLYGHLARLCEDGSTLQVVSSGDDPGWKRPVGRPRKSWFRQIDQICHDEVEIGCALAQRLARDPQGWTRTEDAARRPPRR